MGNNSLTQFPTSENVFGAKCKTALKVMDISYNLIDELQSQQFAGLSSLVDLSVSNNNLKAITVDMMGGTSTTKLEKLDLSGNKIDTIADYSLGMSTFNTVNFQYLDLKNNSLTELRADMFKGTRISYNPYTYYTSLIYLDLSDNMIGYSAFF